MNLAELAPLPSFALLGPGFGAGRFVLLSDLRDVAEADPMLVFAPFEADGARALRFSAGSLRHCDVEVPFPASPSVPIELDTRDYERKIAWVREAIARGDVYQVCLTARALLPPLRGADLFSLVCSRGVRRFVAWVRLPDGTEFVSASPELFFEIRGRHVHAEPMKGTARPGAARQLESSAKERSELDMITDLLRNDLAQVCRSKTVQVATERRVLQLPYALQTVSDVVGVLEDGVTALEVLAKLHPGASVTGAPKGAALRIIRQLESGPRGAYCGALGLIQGERSTFSLLIRTATRTDAGWSYGVGGGIVYDSDARSEVEELETKLEALRCPIRS